MKQNKYLFILSPPFSGTTLLWKVIGTSKKSSLLPDEGHRIGKVKNIIDRDYIWNPKKEIPWEKIKSYWEKYWDKSKPVLVEKSPSILMRHPLDIRRVFPNSYFIIMHRNPYAFAESYIRRGKIYNDVKSATLLWVKMMNIQRKNLKTLKNYIHFSYEKFTDNPQEIKNIISNFIPELEDININRKFKVHDKQCKIKNFNHFSIRRLTNKDVKIINTVLYNNYNLMSFFGYSYIKPSSFRKLKKVFFKIVTRIIKKS